MRPIRSFGSCIIAIAAAVLSLGSVAHFEQHAGYWEQRRSQLALPPYWFFLLPERREFLIPHIHADHSVGVHVPKEIADEPSQRPIELQGVDLFTRPGETRKIPLPDERPE